MPSDLTTKNDKSIDDLLKTTSSASKKIKVSSDDTADALKSKMLEIEEKKKEEAAMNEAQRMGVEYIFLKGFPISPEALLLLSEEEAKATKAICFFKTDREIRLGAVDPNSKEALDLLERLKDENRVEGQIYLISQQSLDIAFELFKSIPRPRKYVPGIEINEEELEKIKKEVQTIQEIGKKLEYASATESIIIIMAGSINSDASDVHIEAEENEIVVRYRIDGILHVVAKMPKSQWPKVISRIKLLAKLKINVTDIPQDGRFTIYLKKGYIDLRVSTVPSAYGESVVMRLLKSTATTLSLEDIGITGKAFRDLEKEMNRPNGMILTTGPTGSGKTSTLYAILRKLNSPDVKIITLENPIEYRVKGIIQSQVSGDEGGSEGNPLADLLSGTAQKKKYTFAGGLRAVLRQDPDIVMVGEIRDDETADIATQAALTGHLMLSTLHTNSAAGAIPRLLSMNLKPYLLAPSLNAVIGQRLARKVCKDCKEEYSLDGELLKRVSEVIESVKPGQRRGVAVENMKFYQGKGCKICNGIGYKGRIGIFEILTMNTDIEKQILTGQVSEYQMQDLAREHGMITMLQDGMLKAALGVTTPEEVLREVQ